MEPNHDLPAESAESVSIKKSIFDLQIAVAALTAILATVLPKRKESTSGNLAVLAELHDVMLSASAEAQSPEVAYQQAVSNLE